MDCTYRQQLDDQLHPPAQTLTQGGTASYTIRVKDQFGNPVPVNTPVTLGFDGRNTTGNNPDLSGISLKTDAAGRASFSYSDKALSPRRPCRR